MSLCLREQVVWVMVCQIFFYYLFCVAKQFPASPDYCVQYYTVSQSGIATVSVSTCKPTVFYLLDVEDVAGFSFSLFIWTACVFSLFFHLIACACRSGGQ